MYVSKNIVLTILRLQHDNKNNDGDDERQLSGCDIAGNVRRGWRGGWCSRWNAHGRGGWPARGSSPHSLTQSSVDDSVWTIKHEIFFEDFACLVKRQRRPIIHNDPLAQFVQMILN